MNAQDVAALLVFIAACFTAALGGALFRPGVWYEQLRKPSWRPPNKLFAPVWTILYLMIAISGWWVWRNADTAHSSLPLAMYALQLVLNASWTPLFFGLHRIDLGLIDIILLWMSIVATIWLFNQVSPLAALLLVPYLLWVTFATALNFSIWRLNR